MNKTNTKTECEYCGKQAYQQHYGTYCCNSCYNDIEEEDAHAILVEIGVPFSSDGEPLGVWSD